VRDGPLTRSIRSLHVRMFSEIGGRQQVRAARAGWRVRVSELVSGGRAPMGSAAWPRARPPGRTADDDVA